MHGLRAVCPLPHGARQNPTELGVEGSPDQSRSYQFLYSRELTTGANAIQRGGNIPDRLATRYKSLIDFNAQFFFEEHHDFNFVETIEF